MKGVAQEAAAQGVSQSAIQQGLAACTSTRAWSRRTARRACSAQTFLQFSDRMVEQYRVKQAPGYIKKYGDTFARIEKQYGVPAEVIVAFWALETDFGQVIGDDQTLVSLATLAYDCRRPDLFRPQLIDGAEDHRPRRPHRPPRCAGHGPARWASSSSSPRTISTTASISTATAR